ncbi:4-coumarate--CoA ligase 2 [Senna tora]|uniref:4-coumarate--CoA ligase 2 n=1 Tax=Senna tora TaxID=362788 RepID=A0A834SFZ2_9FABA|nr:4-coumarate--CoA ligase 2 [Senna tora]
MMEAGAVLSMKDVVVGEVPVALCIGSVLQKNTQSVFCSRDSKISIWEDIKKRPHIKAQLEWATQKP